MKIILFISLLTFCIGFNALSQNKIEANVGLGIFEGYSFKVKYGENIQLGVSQGFFMSTFWLSGLEGYFHFTGDSELTEQKTFYLMLGASSNLFTKGYETFENIIIYPRIGKTFNFSPYIGLNLDAGLAVLMTKDLEGYASFIFPSGSFHLFVRI